MNSVNETHFDSKCGSLVFPVLCAESTLPPFSTELPSLPLETGWLCWFCSGVLQPIPWSYFSVFLPLSHRFHYRGCFMIGLTTVCWFLLLHLLLLVCWTAGYSEDENGTCAKEPNASSQLDVAYRGLCSLSL